MTHLLSGHDLRLFRGDRCLFEHLQFDLATGELLLIAGPNGSGKTSLLRAISGLIDLDDGEILWQGTQVDRQRQAFRANVVWSGHRAGFKGDLTFIENLRFEAGLRTASTLTADGVFTRLGLTAFREIPFRMLSAGQQRRVALARMLLARATLWILDEPFTNLDTAGRQLVIDLLQDHLAGGGVCVMASHQDVAIDAVVQRITLR